MPQVLLCENSAEDKTTELTARLPEPEFVTVTDCPADCWPTSVGANVSEDADKVTAGTPTPLPVSPAVTGAVAPVQVTDKLPVRAPVAVGLKVKLAVQEVPTARLAPQLLDTA